MLRLGGTDSRNIRVCDRARLLTGGLLAAGGPIAPGLSVRPIAPWATLALAACILPGSGRHVCPDLRHPRMATRYSVRSWAHVT